MKRDRVDEFLEVGTRWAKTKLMRGRNQKKSEHLDQSLDQHIVWLKGEMDELCDELEADDCDWQNVCMECGDIIAFAAMLAEYAELRI